MSSQRKLKRGLEDVSPLFRPSGNKPTHKPQCLGGHEVRSIGIFRPEDSPERNRLGQFLAWRLSDTGMPVTVLSLEASNLRSALQDVREPEPYHPDVTHRRMTYSRYESVCQRPVPKKEQLGPSSQFLVLEADLQRLVSPEKIYTAMDQCILVMRPESESITEAYKFIKAGAAFGSGLEYYMLLEDDPQGAVGSVLFERFSEILSRQLGIGINWLGSLPGKAGRTADSRFSLDPLLQYRGLGNGAPEKFALAESLMAREAQILGQAS